MKPDKKSIKALQYTQSVAKMIEFEVPQKDLSINIKNEPEDLLILTLGILTDYAREMAHEHPNNERLLAQEENIRFCASYFDAYKNSRRFPQIDEFFLLIGATAYYLARLPGSSNVLLNNIVCDNLNINKSLLDQVLFIILSGKKHSLNMRLLQFVWRGWEESKQRFSPFPRVATPCSSRISA